MTKNKKFSKGSWKRLNMIKRREKLKKIIGRGFTNKLKIADELNVSEVTVRRDLDAIREEIIKDIRTEPIEKILFEMATSNSEIIKEAWKMYNDANSTQKTKTLSLRIVLDAMEKKVKVLSALGIIPKESSVEINVQSTTLNQTNVLQILQKIRGEEIEKGVDYAKEALVKCRKQ